MTTVLHSVFSAGQLPFTPQNEQAEKESVEIHHCWLRPDRQEVQDLRQFDELNALARPAIPGGERGRISSQQAGDTFKALIENFKQPPVVKNDEVLPDLGDLKLSVVETLHMNSMFSASMLLVGQMLGSLATTKSEMIDILSQKQEKIRNEEVKLVREQMEQAIEAQNKAKKAGIFSVVLDWVIAAVTTAVGVLKTVAGVLTCNPMLVAGGVMDTMAGMAGFGKAICNTLALIDSDNAGKYHSMAQKFGYAEIAFSVAGAAIDITSAIRSAIVSKVIPKVAGEVLESAVGTALKSAVTNASDDALKLAVKEATTEALKEASEKAVSEAIKEVTENAVTGAMKEMSEKVLVGAVKDASQEAVSEAIEKATKKAVTEALKEATEKTVKEAMKDATQEAVKNTLKEATEKTVATALEEATEKAVTDVLNETTEKAVSEALKDVNEKVVSGALKQATEEAITDVLKEATEKAVAGALKEATETAVTGALKEATEKAVTGAAGEAFEKTVKESMNTGLSMLDKVQVNDIQKLVEQSVTNTVKRNLDDAIKNVASETAKKIGDDVVKKLGGKTAENAIKKGLVSFTGPNPAKYFAPELIEEMVEATIRKSLVKLTNESAEVVAKKLPKRILDNLTQEVMKNVAKLAVSQSSTIITTSRQMLSGTQSIAIGVLEKQKAEIQRTIDILMLDLDWLRNLFQFFQQEKEDDIEKVRQLQDDKANMTQDGIQLLSHIGSSQAQMAASMV